MPSTPAETSESEAPASPSKRRRQPKPYDPAQPEKLWILKQFLQLGAPLLVEDYEASLRDPKALFKQRKAARAVGRENVHAKGAGRKKRDPTGGMRENALMRHVKVTKAALVVPDDGAEKHAPRPAPSSANLTADNKDRGELISANSGFHLPSTQVPAALIDKYLSTAATQPVRSQQARPAAGGDSIFAAFAKSKPTDTPTTRQKRPDLQQQRTPTKARKRRSPELSTPRAGGATITAYFSPTPKASQAQKEVISLLSSSPIQPREDPVVREVEVSTEAPEDPVVPLPSTVTKRRRKGPLRKSLSAPVRGEDGGPLFVPQVDDDVVERTDLASPTPRKREEQAWLPSSLPTPPAEEAEEGKGLVSRTDESEEGLPDLLSMRAGPRRSPRSSRQRQSDIADAPAPVQKASATRPLPAADLPSMNKPPPLLSQPTTKAPPKRPKNTHILLRPSLDGAWKEASTAEVEQMDLTGDSPRKQSRRQRAWRLSKVEVLDLTEEG